MAIATVVGAVSPNAALQPLDFVTDPDAHAL